MTINWQRMHSKYWNVNITSLHHYQQLRQQSSNFKLEKLSIACFKNCFDYCWSLPCSWHNVTTQCYVSCHMRCQPFSSDSDGLVNTMRWASRTATKMCAAPLVTARQLTALHLRSGMDATVLNLQRRQPQTPSASSVNYTSLQLSSASSPNYT